MNDWKDYYEDAIERLGMNDHDARWHADMMMDAQRPVPHPDQRLLFTERSEADWPVNRSQPPA